VWVDLDASWGHSTNKWARQNSTLSEFLLQRLISEAPWWAPWGGSGFISAATADALEQRLDDLGLPYCSWPSNPTKQYGGLGLLVELYRDGTEAYASAAAASREAMEEARGFLPIHWQPGPRVIPE
jgi:hypothetical protein